MKTQQCCVFLGALGEVSVGGLLVLVSMQAMDPNPVLHRMEPAFAPAVLGLGGTICAVGCLGMCGACSSSRPAICIYGVATLVVAVVAFILAGSLLATVNGHGEELSRGCSGDRSTGQVWSKLTQRYQASYSSMKEALMNCRRNGRQDALGLQDCGQLGKDNTGRWYLEDPYQPLFDWIEMQSGCGGFCDSDIPLFAYPANPGPGSNPVDQSTKLKLRNPCVKELVDRLEVKGDQIAAIIVGLGAPLLLSVCGALWIVCYPPPRPRKGYVHSPYDDYEGKGENGHLLPSGAPSDSDEENGEEEPTGRS